MSTMSSQFGNGLHHLVEAATALTQLGPSFSAPSSYEYPADRSPSTSSTVLPMTDLTSRSVSDDDIAMSSPARLPLKRSSSNTSVAASTKSSSSSNNVKNDKEIFPMRLHSLLADPTVVDVISWLPHGRSFVVLRPDIFATRVLPRYFAPEGSNSPNAKNGTATAATITKQAPTVSPVKEAGTPVSHGVHKYPSFTRKLNRWGFRQISRGVDAGAFRHELFRKDDREICRSMVCQKSRKPSGHGKASKSGGSPPQSDDTESVMSSSTSASSGTKRPYAATVSVTATEASVAAPSVSNESCVIATKSNLPPKKRRAMPPVNVVDAIPVMMGRQQAQYSSCPESASPVNRPVPQDVVYKGNSYSVAESELTSNSSENSSVCSSIMARTAIARKAPSPLMPAPAAMTQPQQQQRAPQQTMAPPQLQQPPQPQPLPPTRNNNSAQLAMEAAAKATLARHFHQQQRALALASLMENSQQAMMAAGVPNHSCFPPMAQKPPPPTLQSSQCVGPLAVTAHPSVLAPTVPAFKVTVSSLPTSSQLNNAQAAKNALYQAYMQALSNP